MMVNKLVPTNYLGVWQRKLLETATSKDDRSIVFWMQTEQYHIDLRIPADRPQLSNASGLNDYNDDALLQLTTQQGFAGITQVTLGNATSLDICQWHREMDFQPPNDALDIGKMVFTDENSVIETGVNSPYLELWSRLPASQSPVSFTLAAGKNHLGLEVPAYMMRAGKYVAFARPRNIALPKADSFLGCIKTHSPSRTQLLTWLDMEISFGEILDKQNWQVKHSTLPFKEGLILKF